MANNKTGVERAADGLERAIAIFKERFPNHSQTISTWPFHRAVAEILRELRNNP